jgi:hypothetical protein
MNTNRRLIGIQSLRRGAATKRVPDKNTETEEEQAKLGATRLRANREQLIDAVADLSEVVWEKAEAGGLRCVDLQFAPVQGSCPPRHRPQPRPAVSISPCVYRALEMPLNHVRLAPESDRMLRGSEMTLSAITDQSAVQQ